RIDLAVRRLLLRRAGRGTAVSIGGDNQAMQPLHAVLLGDKFRGEPIEQLRGHGMSTQDAKVAYRRMQPSAEVPLPKSIYSPSREQRVFRRRQPIHKRFAPALTKIDFLRRERKTWRHRLAFLGTGGVASDEHVIGFGGALGLFGHRPENRQGLWRFQR